ncbi:MAG: hypothetical protein Q8M24_18040 [Pseudolabrys sp.]|nr:hypothetical protein [Pseudolabrys sp.]
MRSASRAAVTISAALLSIAEMFWLVQPVEASRPVRKTIIGCVTTAGFVSDDGYAIRLRDASTRQALVMRELRRRRVAITGYLLPGDVFFVSHPPRVLGRCR